MKSIVLAVAVMALALVMGTANAQKNCVGPQLRGCGAQSPTAALCFARNLEFLFNALSKGLSSIKVPSLDPLSVPNMSMKTPQGQTLDLTKCSVTGASAAKIADDFKYSLNPVQSSWTLTLPTLVLKCSYSNSAGFLGAPKSSGTFTYTAKNYRSKFAATNGAIKNECTPATSFVDLTGLRVSSTFLKPDSFTATFTGAKIDATRLEPLLTAAFVKAQADVNLSYLQAVYAYMPAINIFLKPGTTNNLPFCLTKRCS